MTADLVYVAGLSLLLAVVLPTLLKRWAVSASMVLVAVGLAIGFTPLPDGFPLDPQENRAAIEHVTELVVIVALMGVGLAIDRPLEIRRLASWRRWSTTWRLLAVGMPLTIAGVAVLGWAVGLSAATALLLGAVLAPTDPVLASDSSSDCSPSSCCWCWASRSAGGCSRASTWVRCWSTTASGTVRSRRHWPPLVLTCG